MIHKITRSRRLTGTLLRLVASACFAVAPAPAEDWPGLEGGGPRHNASAVDVPPHGLQVLWQRSFAGKRFGKWDQEPVDQMQLPGARGSRNLCLVAGKLALVAADGAGAGDDWHLCVLDAADGSTLNCVRIVGNVGNDRVYNWPHNAMSGANDGVTGFMTTLWDSETGILFTAQSGYSSGFTAYLPLANAGTWRGKVQDAVPAYGALAERHPGFGDSFNRIRAEQVTRIGTNRPPWKGLQPWAWGPAGVFPDPSKDPDGKGSCFDLTKGLGFDAITYYNISGFPSGAPDSPLIGIGNGYFTGHIPAGTVYLYNKHTGMKAMTALPPSRVIDNPPYAIKPTRVHPFVHDGMVVSGSRLFFAGPGDDTNRDGRLGLSGRSGCMPLNSIDQGLYLWACDYRMEDVRDNDGYQGPGAAETTSLSLAFNHRFPSRFEVRPNDADSGAESWIECDGFYRNKAFLADRRDAWFAWKPSRTAAIVLIHASDQRAREYDLGIGGGMEGVDLWPHLSLTRVGGRTRLVYFAGHGQHRRHCLPDAATAERILLERYIDVYGRNWARLEGQDRHNLIADATRNGFWGDDLRPPRGPAQLAVFDAEAERVQWTYEVSSRHRGFPANDFWSHLDLSQMVVAGRWVYVGWVDTAGEKAVLRLVAFDLSADRPTPVEQAIALAFPSAGNRKTALFELIAADGRLYAMVTCSDWLWTRDPRWTEQRVVALAPTAGGGTGNHHLRTARRR